MKPTSLSQEFYEKLYEEIENYGFEPETEEDSACNMEFEDVEGFYVTLDASFTIKFVDDSFDHAFGTEHAYHFETDYLAIIDAVTITDEEGNDLSDLFDYDAFWEQFKRYEVKFIDGDEIKSGETVIGVYNGYPQEEVTFLYRDTLKKEYVCKRNGQSWTTRFKKVLPATEENRKRLPNR